MHHGGDVLARPGEAGKDFIIDDDLSVYITSDGVCTVTVFTVFDLTLKLYTLLL